MSTRMYPNKEQTKLSVNGFDGTVYSLDKMKIKYN